MGRGASSRPAVSVCIPAYNAQDTIVQTLDSVWSQTFGDLEVVVVDDHSTDATAAILSEQPDPRLRVLRNPRNLRAPLSSTRAVQNARGRLIKFLDADDTLAPDCLARMVEIFERGPDVGMAFCRRALLLEDPEDEGACRWQELYGDVSSHFGALEEVNDGPELLARWVAGGFDGNWVGEPLVVMVRRDVLERTGGFNPSIRQRFDLDLWARVMPLGSVGFIPEQLATYRVASGSLTARNQSQSLDWLDRLWALEGLRCHPQLRHDEELERLRGQEWKWVRHQLRDLLRRPAPARRTRLADALRLARWLVRSRVRPAARPFPAIGPSPA